MSFKLQRDWSVGAADFYPPLKAGVKYVHRQFGNGAGCANGTEAAGCVAQLNDQQSVPIPKSDLRNITGGTDLAPVVTTLWPLCKSGWALLGDLTKYVSVSTVRFQDVACTLNGISATVSGTPGEAVPVTFLRPGGNDSPFSASIVLVLDVTIPASGAETLQLPTAAKTESEKIRMLI